MYKFKVVVGLDKQGEFPTFKEAFEAMQKMIKKFRLPSYTKDYCWILYLKNGMVISFSQAQRIARKIGFLLPERRKKDRT